MGRPKKTFNPSLKNANRFHVIKQLRGKYVHVKTLHGDFTGYLRITEDCMKGEYRIGNTTISSTDIIDIEEV